MEIGLSSRIRHGSLPTSLKLRRAGFTVHQKTIRYSLFAIRCSLFAPAYAKDSAGKIRSRLRQSSGGQDSLFTVYCSLFTVHCLLFTVYCSLFFCSIQTLTCSPRIFSGSGPLVRMTSWNSRRSNFWPSSRCAIARNSRIRSMPIL